MEYEVVGDETGVDAGETPPAVVLLMDDSEMVMLLTAWARLSMSASASGRLVFREEQHANGAPPPPRPPGLPAEPKAPRPIC